MRTIRRVAGLALAGTMLLASPAAAHVTANPGEASKGGFAKIAFRVPNERDDAGTVKVEVQMPTDHPIENVSVRPTQGWEVTPTRSGERVTSITWTGGTINPGEFQEFEVSLGPLPEDADELVFKALQTYSDGEVVSWIEPTPAGGEEPEHPAPVVKLVASTGEGDHHDDGEAETATTVPAVPVDGLTQALLGEVKDDVDGAKTQATVALALGALGFVFGAGAMARSRRRADT